MHQRVCTMYNQNIKCRKYCLKNIKPWLYLSMQTIFNINQFGNTTRSRRTLMQQQPHMIKTTFILLYPDKADSSLDSLGLIVRSNNVTCQAVTLHFLSG